MFVSQITLTPLEQALIVAFLAYSALSGRLNWLLGFHLAVSLWTRVFLLGGISGFWYILAAVAVAAVADWHRHKRYPQLPPRHRGIVVWMGLWWAWVILLIVQFEPYGARGLLRQVGAYIIIPVILIAQYAWTPARIRGFALSYILLMLYGGWKALEVLNVDLAYLLGDPTLSQTSIVRLNLENYHWFGYGFALALLLTLGLFLLTRRNLIGSLLLALNAAICIYFLFLSGSRQALNGAVIAGALIVLWALLSARGPRLGVTALALGVTALGAWIYNTAPQLLLRDGETAGALFDLVGDRGDLWLIGWHNFLLSPVWGTGWEYAVCTHNLFISVLVDQGVVGLVFFVGLLVFLLWQLPGVLRGVGSPEIAIWRITFLGVVVFTLIHSMASGNTLSVWYFYWAVAFLWVLRAMVSDDELAPRFAPVVRGSVDGRPIYRASAPSRTGGAL